MAFLKRYKTNVLLLITLLAMSVLLFRGTIQLPPSYVHAWTQSERYAIALRFLDNGFDLFHPATFNLQTVDGITRVDLPLNEFVVAILMKICGSTSPFIFRGYMLLIGIIGLHFLYLLARRITNSEIRSWLVVLFVFFSPIYLYYLPGFIPCVPAISFVFAALYYFHRYLDEKTIPTFLFAALFFLLAGMIRTPFMIFLISLAIHVGFEFVRRRSNVKVILILAIVFGVFLLYYRYNVHLGMLYGNMFLDTFLPAKSWPEFVTILRQIWYVWFYQYFSLWHYLLLLILLLLSLLRIRRTEKKERPFWFFLLICGSGAVLYFILMACQFHDHDYYFLDSLFVPIVLLFLLQVNRIDLSSELKRYIIVPLLFISAFFMYGDARTIQFDRYKFVAWDRVEISRRNFENADRFLDENGVAKDAKILVLDAYSTNIPLYSMNRKGYTVYQTSRDNAAFALYRYPWDYVVIQDAFLSSDVLNYFPVTAYVIEPWIGNGKFSVYKRSREFRRHGLAELLRLNKRELVHSALMDFEDQDYSQSPYVGFDSLTNSHVGLLRPEFEFGVNVNVGANELKGNKQLAVLATVKIRADDLSGIKMVVTVTNEKKNLFYADWLVSSVGGHMKEFYCPLPEFKNKNDIVSVYLWNTQKRSAVFDDLTVKIYGK